DVGVGVLYIIGILTAPLPFFRQRDTLADPAAVGALWAFAAVSYTVWIFGFAIYRYIVALEMLAPILIVGAIALWPVGRTVQWVAAGIIGAGILLTMRYDILE